jgi:hypothetical protein
MNNKENPFDNLPGFKETIARIARVPADQNPKKLAEEFVYSVTDETHKISYKIISHRKLSPADVRRALAKSFTRTDVWPNEAGEVEIRL